MAAEAGHTEAVQALTQAGADVFAQDRNGYCALELAQMAGKQETSCALLDSIGGLNEFDWLK
ncbi:MAG: ankyrin repeat domain-containing protein [Gammaproteobacteria bacterium]|nr:ankyrin repeat domain-containing protein [Gammaproteobacteria bacterium]